MVGTSYGSCIQTACVRHPVIKFLKNKVSEYWERPNVSSALTTRCSAHKTVHVAVDLSAKA